MSKPDVWMPLYIGEYLADTMRLTTVQHGAYMLLLMQYWKSGPLPDDEAELAGITKMEPRAWAKISASLRRFFTIGEDGLLHQKRADAERQKAADISAKRRQASMQRTDRKPAEPDQNGGGEDASEVQLQVQLQELLHTHARGLPPSPSKKEDSEAKASDAEPASKPPSPRDLVWSQGVPLLAHLTGKSPSQCRSLLGKMLRDLRDDCPKLLLVLQQAQEARPVDPLAWLNAATQPRLSPALSRDERILQAAGLLDDGMTLFEDLMPERGMLQ